MSAMLVFAILSGLFNCITSFSTVSLTKHKRFHIQQKLQGIPSTVADLAYSVPTQHNLFTTSMVTSVENVEQIGYSNLSLYFTLALYLVSLPGLYSLITRSVKPSITRRNYDVPGPANPTAKTMRQNAAEIMAYFKALNYEVSTAEDVITFKGVMGRSNSQAAFLTFCTFMGLGSFALVVSILLPDVGSKAYFITLLSPYAGIYYWNNAQRVDEVAIKMEASDDEQVTTITAQGDKDDLERFSKALNLSERGKVYVKGLFESQTLSRTPVQTETAEVDNLTP